MVGPPVPAGGKMKLFPIWIVSMKECHCLLGICDLVPGEFPTLSPPRIPAQRRSRKDRALVVTLKLAALRKSRNDRALVVTLKAARNGGESPQRAREEVKDGGP